tara:strand:- start:29 stop:400 length:372 start_codon:yes stop_codon:yes gene_type:complete
MTWNYYNIEKEDKVTDEQVKDEIREAFGAFAEKLNFVSTRLQGLRLDPDMKSIHTKMRKIAPELTAKIMKDLERLERIMGETLFEQLPPTMEDEKLTDMIIAREPYYDSEFSEYRTKRTGSEN